MFTKPILSRAGTGFRIYLETLALAGAVLQRFSYRGLFALAARAKWLTPRGSSVVIQVHPSVTLDIPSDDAYWLCFIGRSRTYEPEIEELLTRFADAPVTFVDAGANVGYWSIMASRRFGWQVFAIEAAPATAATLRRNLQLNKCHGVNVLERAVSERDDVALQIRYDRLFHAGARVVNAPAAALQKGAAVRSITIDTILKNRPAKGITLIKLDVEGNERAAILGAQHTLTTPCVLVYEEHGSNPECAVTGMLIAWGFEILHFDGRVYNRLATVEQARQHLLVPSAGYNFLASRTDWALRRLLN
jgi:FkbM family methyltransferase